MIASEISPVSSAKHLLGFTFADLRKRDTVCHDKDRYPQLSVHRHMCLSSRPLSWRRGNRCAALRILNQLLKDAGVTSFEPRVVSHLMDRMRSE